MAKFDPSNINTTGFVFEPEPVQSDYDKYYLKPAQERPELAGSYKQDYENRSQGLAPLEDIDGSKALATAEQEALDANKNLYDLNQEKTRLAREIANMPPEAQSAYKKYYGEITSIMNTPLTPDEISEVTRRLNQMDVERQTQIDHDNRGKSVGGGGQTIEWGPSDFNDGYNWSNGDPVTLRPSYEWEDFAQAAVKQTPEGGDVWETQKSLYKEELYRRTYEAKIDQVLRKAEDELEDWSSFGDFVDSFYTHGINNILRTNNGLNSVLGLSSLNTTPYLRTENDKAYSSFRNQMETTLSLDQKIKQAEFDAAYKKAMFASASLEKNATDIEGLILDLEKSKTQEEWDGYKKLFDEKVAAFQATRQMYEDYHSHILDNVDYLAIAPTAVDMVGRSYDALETFDARFNAWLANTASGLTTFAEETFILGLSAQSGHLNPDISRMQFREAMSAIGLSDTPAAIVREKMDQVAKEQEASVRYRQALTDVESWSDFADASVDLAGDQIGQVGLMMLTGGTAGTVIMGTTSAGQKMNEMIAEMNNSTSPVKYSPLQFYGAAYLYGLAEAGSEYVTFNQIGRSFKALRGAHAAGAVTTDQLRNSFTNSLIARLGKGAAEEGYTEALSQISQNLVDTHVLDKKGVQWYDGVDEAFLSGALMSVMMFQSPEIAAATIKMFNTRSEIEKVRTNQAFINAYSDQQFKLAEEIRKLEAQKQAGESIDQKQLDRLNKDHADVTASIEDLLMANMAMMYTGIDRLDNLTAKEKSDALYFGKGIHDIRSQIEEKITELRARGLSADEIANSATIKQLNEQLVKKELNLYDVFDFSNSVKDRESLWSSLESFSLDHGGVPSLVLATADPDAKSKLVDFVKNPDIIKYFVDRYGGAIAAKAIVAYKKQVKEYVDRVNDKGNIASVLRASEVIDGVEVEMPLIMISKRGSFRHEGMHMTLFNALAKNGGAKLFGDMSEAISRGVDALYAANPERYGALKRYSDHRKGVYQNAIRSSKEYVAYQKHIDFENQRVENIKRRASDKRLNEATRWVYEKQIEKINKDLQQYKDWIDHAEATIAEEHMIAVTEYMAATNTDFTPLTGKSFTTRIAEKLGLNPGQYDPNNAGDMIRMLQTFNKQFDNGKTRRTSKLIKSNNLVKGTGTKMSDGLRGVNSVLNNISNESQEVSKKAREAADKVNSLYAEKGMQAAWEISELYKPMIYKIISRKDYKGLPNWDVYVEDIVSEALYGSTGLLKLMETFDPSKGVPLSAYINSLLPQRISGRGGIVDKFFKGATFALQVDEIQVSEESAGSYSESSDFSEDYDALSEEDVLKAETPAGLKPGYSRVRQRLKLSEQLMNRIRGVVLMNLLFNPDLKSREKWSKPDFVKNLRNNFAKELFDLLKGKEGLFPQAQKEWFDYAEKMYDWLITDVPLSTWLNHSVKIFYEPDIDPVTGKQKRLTAAQAEMRHTIGDKYAGDLMWKSVTPTKEQFMSWVKAEGMAYTTIGTRKDLLARALVRQMAFDATLETLTNPMQERFDPQTGLPTGRTVNVFEYWEMMTGEPQDEIKITAQVAVMINRDPGILFNLAGPTDEFDIPSFIAGEVNKRINTREFKDKMSEAEGDISQQRRLAEEYANAIIDVIDQNTIGKSPNGILNANLSPAFKSYIVEELLQIGLEEMTHENAAWKEAYRAGIQAANARLTDAKAKQAAKKQKEISDAASAEVAAANKSAATAEAQAKEKSSKWNEFMAKVFPFVTKEQIDASTAKSIYSRKPFWKKFSSIMSPMAEDFMGLLYWTLGKGKLGDEMREFYTKNLLEPFNRGSSRFDASKVNILNGFRVLNKSFKGLKKTFGNVVFTNSHGRSFTVEDAIKVKLWTNLGYAIPDIAQEDLNSLLQVADGIPNVNPYVKGVMALFTKSDGSMYEIEKPKEQRGKKGGTREGWSEVPLKLYISATVNGDVRKHHLKEFSRNADAIFDEYNLNKLAAIYGQKYVDALQESINAMKNGRGEFVAKNPAVRALNTWMNGSIASIMFLNARSAVLQLVSTTNYFNWSDNAPWNAIRAFRDPVRFAKSFVELMQSDFMKIRRNSGQIDVDMQDAEDFANSMKSLGGIGRVFAYMSRLGYIPTKYADSAAILMGGVPFYINRIDTYKKQGMSEQEAKDKAFDDFRESTETSQQSSRMDKLSAQQRHPVLKMFLAFGNTSGQYSRIIVKSMKDIKNGRGDFKTNVGKILYYAALQNAIFTAAQNALFRFFLDDEEEDLERLLASSEFERTMNSMIDNLARGFGIYGALAVTLKNTYYKYVEVTDPEWKKEHFYGDPSMEVLKVGSGVMPALSRKVTGVTQLMTNISYHNSMVKKLGDDTYWDDNTIEGWAGFTEAFANIPIKRLLQKYDNLNAAYNNEYHTVLRIANVLGWPDWQVDPEGTRTKAAAERAAKVADKTGVIKTEDMTQEQIKEYLRNPPSPTNTTSGTPKSREDIRKELLNPPQSSSKSSSLFPEEKKTNEMTKEELRKKLLGNG